MLNDRDANQDYYSQFPGSFKHIPAGSFQRDSDPLNISTVKAFYMSKYQTTKKQYCTIMEIVGSNEHPFNPMKYVIWFMALIYCNKLSGIDRLQPVYSINGITDPEGWSIRSGSHWDITNYTP